MRLAVALSNLSFVNNPSAVAMGGEPDDEELQKAFRMSLQPAPEAKRSKPRDGLVAPSSPPTSSSAEDSEVRARRIQRELRAAAAEHRMLAAQKDSTSPNPSRPKSNSPDRVASSPLSSMSPQASPALSSDSMFVSRGATAASTRDCGDKSGNRGKKVLGIISEQLPVPVAEQLFNMVFGASVPRDVIVQWCNQGFSFGPDKETSLGLVQREGGPCGVLAPVQALVLKYLLFMHEGAADSLSHGDQGPAGNVGLAWLLEKSPASSCSEVLNPMLVFSEAQRTRALVSAMAETLWLAGGKQRAVVAVLDIPGFLLEDGANEEEQDEAIVKALEGLFLDSIVGLQRFVRVFTLTSMPIVLHQLQNFLPWFRSRVGALLFLFSALLSRGLDAVQSDRDDPAQPLVTTPFGHASQEIVNLLVCGHAVSNVFDGNIDLGGGMCLKGIPTNVEVGFLTLLEALNLCKVGQCLKCPRWPIWVVGSETHYTVLFALQCNVQDENELEDRERRIRQVFDAHDQSGGGGFISAEALQQVLHAMNINMPGEMFENFRSSDIVVWNELWQALHQIEKTSGGLKDPGAVSGKRQFELYHFNGIAKSVGNSSLSVGEVSQQRPRLAKLRVTVPPKWTPEEFMMDYKASPEKGNGREGGKDLNTSGAVSKEEPAQHAPLVDCIRTRWQRATCNWSGDAPSIV